MYFVINICLDGLSGYIKSDTVYYIISRIGFNLMGIFFCIFSSISMIPKGKIILASIYLGIIILSLGFLITSFLFLGSGEYKLWQIIYEAILTLSAGIISLVYTLIWEKEQKEKANKITLTY
ncbi:hypothetical protein D3C71_1604260 [compost metagenome]